MLQFSPDICQVSSLTKPETSNYLSRMTCLLSKDTSTDRQRYITSPNVMISPKNIRKHFLLLVSG